jgi:hypothetical protein
MRNALLQELQSLEAALHHPGVRGSRERLEQLLHPEFHEVGRSGRTYSRESIFDHLAAQQTQPVVVSDSFAVSELGPGIALLSYRSAHVDSEAKLVHHTLRSSVWLKTTAGWQLRYHQGTPAQTAW